MGIELLHIDLALSAAFLLPVGTDKGIAAMGGASSFLLMPLSLCIVKRNIERYENCNYLTYSMNVLVFAYLLWRAAFTVASGSWADRAPRWRMFYTVKESNLATVLVTKERASEIDDALIVLKKYVKKGDYLFCNRDIATINYLTETVPYPYCSEPGFLTPALFKKHILKAENEIKTLPVVITEKEFANNNGLEIANQYFYDFLKKHEYKKIWESEKFEIYIPN